MAITRKVSSGIEITEMHGDENVFFGLHYLSE
jgi:hypothetical protein